MSNMVEPIPEDKLEGLDHAEVHYFNRSDCWKKILVSMAADSVKSSYNHHGRVKPLSRGLGSMYWLLFARMQESTRRCWYVRRLAPERQTAADPALTYIPYFAEGWSAHKVIPRCCHQQSSSIQRQGCAGCRMWNRDTEHVRLPLVPAMSKRWDLN